ncbi:universal stress protein [Bacteroidales bacterium OttesenSCG-928-I21]|nr:universal stress protein [Bacteroidales bacterium OttesenSCG-928-I21]
MEKCILVPHDFTEKGNYALEHAFMLSKATNIPIHLLHIVKRKDEICTAEENLAEIAKNADKDAVIITAVRKGSIFKEIYKYGQEKNAYLVVMGTHGVKNIKKAMKVVKKFVRIPFILVQSPIIYGEYSKVLVPLDTEKSSRIKTQWVNHLNFLFKSKAYILTHAEKDQYKAKYLANNLRFVQDQLDKQLIDYELKNLDFSKNFADEMYSFAEEIQANIILIMTHNYRDYIKDLKKSKSIELYKKIPIMCVNKRSDLFKAGRF